MRLDLTRLFEAVGSVIGVPKLSDCEIGERFAGLMHALVTFDYVVVFAYRGEERPIELYSTFGPDDYVIFVSLYLDGAYLLDPFYRRAREPGGGVHRMREMAPDRFFSGEYYRTYYVKTGLAEEIGFFVAMEDGTTIVLSLMRSEATGAFSTGEFGLLTQAEPMVRALVQQFWSGTGRRFDDAMARAHKNRQKGGPDGPGRIWRTLNLTEREAAIIELVLQGHSSESIGLRLGISTGTVKVHRRNVYRKLGISSQTQLLSIYLDNLTPSA